MGVKNIVALGLLVIGLGSGVLLAQQVTKESVPGIRNLARLETTVACSGAITVDAVPEIKKMGFASIVNLRLASEAGADVVGVDWRIPLDVAAGRIGPGKGLQGNLDPAILFAGWDVIEREVRRIAAEADRARAAGSTGHIFNLGHGVLPDTDPTVLTRVVELVHSL